MALVYKAAVAFSYFGVDYQPGDIINTAGWNATDVERLIRHEPVYVTESTSSTAGWITTQPAVPLTATPYTNAGGDALVIVTANSGSACVVTVDGHAVCTLPASEVCTVLVPGGKTIQLAYTAAPGWSWWAL